MTRRRSLALALISVLSLIAAAGIAGAQMFPREAFDRYVAKALRDFEAPGVSVAIVKDGVVVLTEGYGVRKLGESARVDADTLFAIGSCTKAFTTAALSMLVDEGKISWDEPAATYLKGFQLFDPYVSRELTVRDLVSHRSGLGLGGGDMLWMGSDYNRDEIVRRIRYLKPASSFRSRYAYQNVMFLTGGQVVPAVTGTSWDDFIKTRIFEPLGMTSSNTSVTKFRPGMDVATPHGRVDGKMQAIEYTNADNIGPAGSINSSAADLAKWVRMHLASGRVGDKTLFSERNAREMWSAQTVIPVVDPPAPLAGLKPTFAAYGLGWGLRDYRGHKIVSHTGGLAGMTCMIALVPDQRLGVIVLTSQELPLYSAIAYWIIDSYLGGTPNDWSAAFIKAETLAQAKGEDEERSLEAKRNKASKPSLALDGYAGRYVDRMYGDATIRNEGGTLVLRLTHSPAFVGELEHWQYDTFRTHWRDHTLADAFVTFSLNPDGSIDTMKMVPVSSRADFSFDYQDFLFKPEAKP